MFVNRSNIAKASGVFTREMVNLMNSYPDLKVYQGEDVQNRDAILLGIITTPKYINETFSSNTEKATKDKLKESIGSRREFFVPTSTIYQVNLRLILIKDPKNSEVELAKTKMVKFLQSGSSKIIFNQMVTHSSVFSREAGDTVTSDSPGIVNFSKNKGNFEKSLSSMAIDSAIEFKETVLDVF